MLSAFRNTVVCCKKRLLLKQCTFENIKFNACLARKFRNRRIKKCVSSMTHQVTSKPTRKNVLTDAFKRKSRNKSLEEENPEPEFVNV